MNDREWMDFEETLRGLRDEPLDEAVLADVRASTLGKIRRDRRRPWLWGIAAVAAALLLAAGLSLRTEPTEVVVVRPAPIPPPIVARALPPAAPRLVPVPRASRPSARRALAKEPMKIQMMTDDPDVVIIWLVGEEGGSE